MYFMNMTHVTQVFPKLYKVGEKKFSQKLLPVGIEPLDHHTNALLSKLSEHLLVSLKFLMPL